MNLNPLEYPNPLIGLIGKKRSGKDTFARTLTEEFGYRRFAFADPMKEALLAVNPWLSVVSVDEQAHNISAIRLASFVGVMGWEEAKKTDEVRRLLQDFGQAIRAIYPEFWILATMVPVDEAREQQPVVITDVRMRNEADTIRGIGGILIRIERPGLPDDDTHISENDLNDYVPDLTVTNDGTLDELAQKARDLVS